MKLSRRQFLQYSAMAGMASLASPPLFAQPRSPLIIPPLMDTGRGRPIRLDFRPAQTQFNAGKLTEVWGGNGYYLAPTVRVKSGDFVKLTYTNSLPQALSINIQGLLAPTTMIGSIHRQLSPNSSWSPIISINQPACSGWYHADTMFNSAFQVYRGIAGLWLIEDNQSRQTQLPHQYGVNDIPLILQDQLINKNGEQVLNPNSAQFFGKQLLVNGQISPYLTVERGWIRLRIVNASLSRPYILRLDNDKPLHLIATGIGMLATPVKCESLTLPPSARIEVLIDLNEGETVRLISGQKRGFFHQIEQWFDQENELIDNVVVELRPEGLAAALDVMPTLPTFHLEDFNLKIAEQRQFTLSPFAYKINQQRFDPKRIDFTVKRGNVERWYLKSDTSIGFTLQGAKFVVETQNQQSLPQAQLAWQDTVWLEKGQITTLLVRFEHQAPPELPFTYGVSDLMLRDRGCMGQFCVE